MPYGFWDRARALTVSELIGEVRSAREERLRWLETAARPVPEGAELWQQQQPERCKRRAENEYNKIIGYMAAWPRARDEDALVLGSEAVRALAVTREIEARGAARSDLAQRLALQRGRLFHGQGAWPYREAVGAWVQERLDWALSADWDALHSARNGGGPLRPHDYHEQARCGLLRLEAHSGEEDWADCPRAGESLGSGNGPRQVMVCLLSGQISIREGTHLLRHRVVMLDEEFPVAWDPAA